MMCALHLHGSEVGIMLCQASKVGLGRVKRSEVGILAQRSGHGGAVRWERMVSGKTTCISGNVEIQVRMRLLRCNLAMLVGASGVVRWRPVENPSIPVLDQLQAVTGCQTNQAFDHFSGRFQLKRCQQSVATCKINGIVLVYPSSFWAIFLHFLVTILPCFPLVYNLTYSGRENNDLAIRGACGWWVSISG